MNQSDPRPAEPVAHPPSGDLPAAALADPDCPFPPLPDLEGTPGAGTGRRIGIEIEFGGIPLDDAADRVARSLGGRPRRLGPGDWCIDSGEIGPLSLYLDTKLRPNSDGALAEIGVEVGRMLIPLELVTPPVALSYLPRIERLMQDLDATGAVGSEAGPLQSFGLHLNVELADTTHGTDMPRVALAFALLEGWLRRRDQPDPSRRLLPFTDPLPAALTDDLVAAEGALDVETLFGCLARHVSTRNHALDLFPAWAAVAPGDFSARGPDTGKLSPRPAYHYRMPDCRIGDPAWSLSYEWRRWVLVESAAADARILKALAEARQRHRNGPLVPDRPAWAAAVTRALGPLAALAPKGGPESDGEDA